MVVAVTGASRPGGIGLSIAAAFGRQGARVVISDIGGPLEAFPDYELPQPEALLVGLRFLRARGDRCARSDMRRDKE